MQKIIVFFDIDGTLIRPDQTPNDKRLPQLVKELSKRGFLFGLNSNRSLEDALPIYKQFCLNGPLVLENGVYSIRGGRRTFLIKNPERIQRRFVEALLRAFIGQRGLTAAVAVTDSVRVLTSPKTSRIPLLFLANGYRKYTGSIHVLRYGVRDRALAKKLASFLRGVFRSRKLDFVVECPRAFGNVTFYPAGAGKGLALRRLRQRYPGYRVYMVGDDVGDLMMLRHADAFFAVDNAAPQAKRKARYVARGTYTKGVVEVLNYLAKQIPS